MKGLSQMESFYIGREGSSIVSFIQAVQLDGISALAFLFDR